MLLMVLVNWEHRYQTAVMSWRMKLQLNGQHTRLDKVSELVARAGGIH
jgi:hypothetical protein